MSRESEAHSYYAMRMEQMKTRPVPAGQKFKPGERVRIADDLGPSMSHFPGAGKFATVKYTHGHAFASGENGLQDYCLDIDDYGEVSWYHEHQLTLIP